MNKSNENEYDIILSLGGSCATANQLKVRCMRLQSLPFDWIITDRKDTLQRLGDCFKNDFTDWLKAENMRPLLEDERSATGAAYQYKDVLTGYRFIHDFSRPLEDVLPIVREKYKRRIDRLFEMLRSAQRVALCFDTKLAGCHDSLVGLRQIILDKFGPSKQIDCYLVEFLSSSQFVSEVGSFHHFAFVQDRHEYLYGPNASYEFSYLDGMRLSASATCGQRGKSPYIYISHVPHGMKIILMKDRRKFFGIDVALGSRKYEFSIGMR